MGGVSGGVIRLVRANPASSTERCCLINRVDYLARWTLDVDFHR